MAPTCSGRVASRGAEESPADSGHGEFFRFLRNGHVLSALLREILEEKFLGELSLHSLTRPQFCSLKLVALNPDLKVGEVARCVGVSPSACTKNIDKLERMGLVLREPDTDDRRATLLRASTAGLELVRQYESMKAAQVGPVIRELGRSKVEQLCDLLEEVCSGLLEIECESHGPCFRCAGYYHADCSVARARGTCALGTVREARPGGLTPGGPA
jgi:DNA-binding MarR family transcriptional regulator